MPIRILSLPGKDLQYALKCMDLGDIIAFSLCSKRTKNLVKSSNRKMDPPRIHTYENRIRFEIQTMIFKNCYEYAFLDIFDSYIELNRNWRYEAWRKQEFTQADWIAHFMSIFHGLMVEELTMETISLSFLDTVKQIIPKINKLEISHLCSKELAKTAFFKLAPISEEVEVEKNIFDKKKELFKCFNLNLSSVNFDNSPTGYQLDSNDLLALKIKDLTIEDAVITGKELNRFLKLWMKRNHTFYRPRYLELTLRQELNREEVFKGIEYQIVNCERQLKRRDGKKLIISINGEHLTLEFRI
ncbi:hypothetical protein B9Z55_029162 [Caenorhabditis nigoni]|uniref:F-box domain-containing protein n=1 Tax=Caenorhabditis nigoni TaxID=1611254 RepID=A0A2G5S8A0_9PELO|nr:hypothetical protein B9Z55_029162 [Caenorhabditis nigoni]